MYDVLWQREKHVLHEIVIVKFRLLSSLCCSTNYITENFYQCIFVVRHGGSSVGHLGWASHTWTNPLLGKTTWAGPLI